MQATAEASAEWRMEDELQQQQQEQQLADELLGEFATDGVSDDEAEELEQVRPPLVCDPHCAEHDVPGLVLQAMLRLHAEQDRLSEEELGRLRGEGTELELQYATAEAVEDDIATKLEALRRFTERAAEANAEDAALFRVERAAQLAAEGRAMLEEAQAAASALSKAMARLAEDTHATMLERMRGLQSLALEAERTLAQLRKREEMDADRVAEAGRLRDQAQVELEAAQALQLAADSEEDRARAEAELREAEARMRDAEARAEAEREAMHRSMVARAEAREAQAAAAAARAARLERLREFRQREREAEEERSRRRMDAMDKELRSMEKMAASVTENKRAEELRRAREAELLRVREAAEKEKAARERRERRKYEERMLARRRLEREDNMFLRLAVPAKHVAFVIDRSGSMTWAGVWPYCLRHLEGVMGMLDEGGGSTFRIVAFNETVHAMSATHQPVRREVVARALAWLERLEVIGGRSPFEHFGPPIAEALRCTEVQQIFLVTDAPGENYEHALAAAKARGVVIHCAYMSPEGRPVPDSLSRIASETGGACATIAARGAPTTTIGPGCC